MDLLDTDLVVSNPFRGCIIATFIRKTSLSTLMWDTNVLLTLTPCVLSQKYLHVSGLDLDLGLEVLTSSLVSTFWPR